MQPTREVSAEMSGGTYISREGDLGNNSSLSFESDFGSYSGLLLREDQNRISTSTDKGLRNAFIPEKTPLNKYLMKMPVLRGGIRFPVNCNVDVNKNYVDQVHPGYFVSEFEASGEYEILTYGPRDPAENAPDGTVLVETVGPHNVLAATVHLAYYEHYPLRLTADVLWFTIMQGLCNHLICNPEIAAKCYPDWTPERPFRIMKRESSFKDAAKNVTKEQFEKYLESETSKENIQNNYKQYMLDFHDEICASLGDDLSALSEQVFTTTNTASRLAFKASLMGPTRHFFKFKPNKGCGIPFIELSGRRNDWVELRIKVKELFSNPDLELDWWRDELLPVIDEFLQAACESPNVIFWASICNIFSMSGVNQPMTGWIQVLYPYVIPSPTDLTFKRNENISAWRKCYYNVVKGGFRGELLFGLEDNYDFIKSHCGPGISLDQIPNGMGRSEFDFVTIRQFQNPEGNWFEEEIREKMSLVSGLVGIIQYAINKALEPAFGWGILRPAE